MRSHMQDLREKLGSKITGNPALLSVLSSSAMAVNSEKDSSLKESVTVIGKNNSEFSLLTHQATA